MFFLTGAYEGTQNRTVTIPKDKGVFFPKLVYEWSYAETPNATSEEELGKAAIASMNNATFVGAELDGKPITSYRVHTTLFYIYFPKDNLFDIVPYGITQAVSDGQWVFLKPLPVGQHTIHLKGDTPDYHTEVNYKINVK